MSLEHAPFTLAHGIHTAIGKTPKEDETPPAPMISPRAKRKLSVGKNAVKKYKRRIESSLSLQRKQFNRWKDTLLKLTSGIDTDTNDNITEGEDLRLNLYRSTLDYFVAATYSRNPYIYVWPGHPDFADSAAVAEKVVNHDWRVLHIKKAVKRIIKDAWLYGMGIGKSGINQKRDVRYKVGRRSKNFDFLRGNSGIYLSRVSPYDFLLSPDARYIEDIGYACHRLILPTQYVKDNPGYKNTDDIQTKLVATQIEEYDDDYAQLIADQAHGVSAKSRHIPVDMRRAVLWEYHDRENEVIITLADGVEDKALRIQSMDHWAWHTLVFNETPDKLYPLSDQSAWEDLVNKLELALNIQLEHMRSFTFKMLYEGDGAIPEEEVKNLASWKNNLVKVNDINGFKELTKQAMTADGYRIQDILTSLLRQESGQNEFQRGGFSKNASATEAAIVDALSRLRLNEKVDTVEDFTEDVAQGLLELRQEHTELDVLIPIDPATLEDTSTETLEVTKEILQGPIFARIEAGATLPVDREVMKKESVELWNLFSPFPQLFNIDVLGTDVLKAYGRQEVGNYLVPQQDMEGGLGSALQDMAGQGDMGALAGEGLGGVGPGDNLAGDLGESAEGNLSNLGGPGGI